MGSIVRTTISGTKCYILNGDYHRADGPAILHPDGSYEWWLYGRRHRLDGPAIHHLNNIQMWYAYGNCHRSDGPAIIHNNGNVEYRENGLLHRLDGPAIERSSYKSTRDTYEWWYRGHRVNVTSQKLFEECLPFLIIQEIQDG